MGRPHLSAHRPGGFNGLHADVQPIDGGTQLTVVETGFQNLPDPEAHMQRNGTGWTQGFARLAAYMDGDS